MSELIQNALYCPECDTFLVSKHTHDFVSCKHGYMVDGGLDYQRGSRRPTPENDFTLWKSSPEDEIMQKLLWGSYGKDGSGPLVRRPIIDLDTDHLEAILRTQPVRGWQRKVIERVLAGRKAAQHSLDSSQQ